MTKILTVSDFETEVLKAPGIVLVDFFASWCGPCQMLSPVIDELAGNPPADSSVFKVDVDVAPELASKYGVMSIPALRVFKNGEVVGEATGVQTIDQLRELIEKAR